MTTPRFATFVGLIIGAVWALAGFDGALITAVLGGGGYLAAMVVQGQLDLSDPFGNRNRST